MPRLLLLLLVGLTLVPVARAQSDTDDRLDLIVTIDPFAHVVSLDDQVGEADARLVFEFAPGLDAGTPEAVTSGGTIALNDRITFATNLDFAHQVDIAVEAANPGDWNDLAITVSPGAIETVSTSTSTTGVAGSCGTTGGPVTITADATEIAAASGITLCHARQIIGYSVELDTITADEADRSFDVTYTILQTSAPSFPGLMRVLALALMWAVAAGAAAQVHVRSGLIVHAEVAPGAEAAAALELFNAGTTPVRLRVYLEDLSFDRGQPAYGTPGSTARSNALWMTLPSTIVDVPPGQATLIPYTTQVPADSSLVGSYWSVALVEEVRPEPVEATDDGRRQVRFRRRSRLGVQLITHVAGAPGTLGFEVSEEAVEAGPEGAALAFTLANTGEQALGPEVLAEVYGADGGLVETVSGGRPILYPGSSVRVRLPLAEAPAGHTALVLIDPGTDEVFGKEIALDGLAPVE